MSLKLLPKLLVEEIEVVENIFRTGDVAEKEDEDCKLLFWGGEKYFVLSREGGECRVRLQNKSEEYVVKVDK